MPIDRASGVLVHPTSFPGPHGIGDLGDAAFRVIDWLHAAGQRYWQIVPLVPVGPGNSPYASVSAFAGNPSLVSLPWLVGDGLLEEHDLRDAPAFPAHRVDYPGSERFKDEKLRRAFDRFRMGAAASLRTDFAAFTERQAAWVDDYALFMAAKQHFGGAGWTEWDAGLARATTEAKAEWRARLSGDVEFHRFSQFLFYRQWGVLKRYANERNLQIIGDIPIFVAHDSADVWAHQALFRLAPSGQPDVVAGVPPDYFSESGQLWGNPHYDWAAMAADGYRWWIDRFSSLLHLVDVVRIDHFRGFAAAWTVPADAPTAASGRWEQGPGRVLFDAVRDALGEVPIIVEDLGLITRDVRALRRELGFPGMAVLHFAFGGDADNAYLPHNFHDPIVVYPGTHDNQTSIGWFRSANEKARAHAQTYLGRDGSDIAWDLIRLALASTAVLAVSSLQDVLRLDDAARMNVPGTGSGNWEWRCSLDQLESGIAAGLRAMTATYGRLEPPAEQTSFDPFDYTAPKTAHPLYT